MSWLSNLFGGGGEDPEAVRQRAAGDAAAANQKALQMQLDYLNQLRSDQAAKDAAEAAKDPTSLRQSAAQQVGSVFAPDFQNTAVSGSLTDPLQQQAYADQYGKAQSYVDNLFKRGVVTDTGRAAALKDLDTQGAKVRTSLSDISDTLLNAERDKVAGIADRARGAASSLNVGDTFDVNPFAGEYNTELGNFQKSLPDKFNAAIPGDLFDTKSLAALAGGAQGAGNQPFDPNALAGTNIPLSGGSGSTDQDPFKIAQTPARTSTVF
jgi:hypothetical protein